MNPIYTLVTIPVLGILNLILAALANRLFHEQYAKHVTTEPARSKHFILPKQIGKWLAITLGLLAGPAVLIGLGFGHAESFPLLSGYTIGYLAFLAAHSLFSVILFKYVKNNPEVIEGHVIFKHGLTKMSIITFIAQAAFFIAIITIFNPSIFLYGVLLALAILLFTTLFAKKPTTVNP